MANNARRQSDFESTVSMGRSPLYREPEIVRFLSTDNVVGRFGEFDELIAAVRSGDVKTISVLCAQSFHLHSRLQSLSEPQTMCA